MLVDPAAGGEVPEQRPVELAGRPVVDVFDAGADMAQLRGPHPGLEFLRAATRGFAVDQQPEPLGVAEIADVVATLQLGEGVGHAVELQLAQLVVCRMVEHRSPPQW